MAEPDPGVWSKLWIAGAGLIGSAVTVVTTWLIHRRKSKAETTSITEATHRSSAQFDIEFSREVRKEIHEATKQLTDAYSKLTKSEKCLRKALKMLRECGVDTEKCDELANEIDAIHGG